MPNADGGRPEPAGSTAADYLAHRDRVFTIIYRLVGHPADAADLTHDAFVRAFEHAASFRGESAVGTWLVRIAINVALAHRRRARWLARLLDGEPSSSPVSSPAVVGPVSSEALDLDRAIRGLPAPLRAAFVLHTVEGCSYVETASVLGTSEAACRQRVHRARTLLAATLREYRDARPGAGGRRPSGSGGSGVDHADTVGVTLGGPDAQ